MANPAEHLEVARDSLRCFACGWASLIPLIGLPFAIVAIRLHFRTWDLGLRVWNPGRRYLLAGFCLAWLGALASLLTLGVLILSLSHSIGWLTGPG